MRTGRLPEAGVPRAKPRTFRLTPRESEMLDMQATYRGFRTASDYLRSLIAADHELSKQARFDRETKMMRAKVKRRPEEPDGDPDTSDMVPKKGW